MAADTLTVRITLRRSVAERLRGMCHAKGLTASDMIDAWVFEHDDAGELRQPAKKSVLDMLDFGGLFGGRR